MYLSAVCQSTPSIIATAEMIPFDRRQHSTSLSALTLMRGRAHVSDFSEGRGGGFGVFVPLFFFIIGLSFHR